MYRILFAALGVVILSAATVLLDLLVVPAVLKDGQYGMVLPLSTFPFGVLLGAITGGVVGKSRSHLREDAVRISILGGGAVLLIAIAWGLLLKSVFFWSGLPILWSMALLAWGIINRNKGTQT